MLNSFFVRGDWVKRNINGEPSQVQYRIARADADNIPLIVVAHRYTGKDCGGKMMLQDEYHYYIANSNLYLTTETGEIIEPGSGDRRADYEWNE